MKLPQKKLPRPARFGLAGVLLPQLCARLLVGLAALAAWARGRPGDPIPLVVASKTLLVSLPLLGSSCCWVFGQLHPSGFFFATMGI